MFQFIENYLTKRRIKALLKRDFKTAKNQPPIVVSVRSAELSAVEGLNPFAPLDAQTFWRQIDKGVDGDGKPWSWDRMERDEEVTYTIKTF